ncbi:hypothetical protein [Flagellimonas sp. 2504JD4-2]
MLLILIGIIYCSTIYAQGHIASDNILQTQYFSFHNNIWMNLHHFLYEQASNGQKNKLREDGLGFRDIGDSLKISELTLREKQLFNKGIEFYKKNIIDQELINSGRIFKWLQFQPTDQAIIDTSYSKVFTENLNRLKPLYVSHFWQRHRTENNNLLFAYIDLIKKIESKVIRKMEKLSGSKWKGVVRIDLTTYGNWASAYSPDFDNIVISSIDPNMDSTIFIEFVFHESSHLLFLRKSDFRMSLFKKTKELNLTQPRSLWHAAMFYLSGLATKEVLNEYGLDHILIMKKKNVFAKYYQNEKFKLILTDYYKSNIELDELATQLLQLN